VRITCDQQGFALGRAFTRGILRQWSVHHRDDDAILVMGELAANAAEHATPRAQGDRPTVGLGLALTPAHLLLAVSDDVDDPPVPADSDHCALEESGRGLAIVEALSDAWGWTRRHPAGKSVWAALSICPLPDTASVEGSPVMCPSPTGKPGRHSTDRDAAATGPAPIAPLMTLGQVPWNEIKDSTGSAAAIPLLLSSVAWGDEQTGRAALEELRKRICQYGFVVEQATAAAVPFLWELAQLPQVTCRPQIIELLRSIADARQWESTATVYPKLLNRRENHVVWERAARRAVHDRRGVLPLLLAEGDAEIARASTELARTLGG
jgi:hypothetical protein